MATLPLRSITNPDILSGFDAAILRQVLDPFRDFLAGLGFVLPPDAGVSLDVTSLATALLGAGDTFPAELADALHTIVETGVATQMGAIEVAARRAHLDLGVTDGATITPIDLAARLWLRAPDLLKRIHAEMSIPAIRRFESWHCVGEDIPEFTLPNEEQTVVPWTHDLEQILVDHQFGTGVRIFVCPSGRLVYFLIRHGATVQRVAVHCDDGQVDSLLYRPAVTDVLRYDPASGELGLHLQKSSKWLSEAIRATFSLHLFNRPHLFTGERRHTLAPIRERGREALDCDGIANIESVELTELEISFGELLDYRVIHKATDVFAALETQSLAVTSLPEPRAAKLVFTLANGTTRKVSLRVPNVAVYQREGDDDVIGVFLKERGFIRPEGDADERSKVA